MWRILPFLITVSFLGLFVFSHLLPASPPAIEGSADRSNTFVTVNTAVDFTQRQGYNECGPFNIALAIQALTDSTEGTQDIVTRVPLRFYRGYTPPQGLTATLSSLDIKTREYALSGSTDQERLTFLANTIANGSPVVLLGVDHGVQHYITVYGYTEKAFHVYDPAYEPAGDRSTLDDNGSLPGNRILTDDELLSFWSQGGVLGLYEWYALVLST